MIGNLTRQLSVPEASLPGYADPFGRWFRSSLFPEWSERAKADGIDDALKCLALYMGERALDAPLHTESIRVRGLVGDSDMTISILAVQDANGKAAPFRAFWSALSAPYSNLLDPHGYLTIETKIMFEDIPAGLPSENMENLRVLKEEALNVAAQV
jgi:hypothetical protein